MTDRKVTINETVAVVLLALSLSACSVKSIDSVTSKQLDLCREIKDEALRVECITSIESPGNP